MAPFSQRLADIQKEDYISGRPPFVCTIDRFARSRSGHWIRSGLKILLTAASTIPPKNGLRFIMQQHTINGAGTGRVTRILPVHRLNRPQSDLDLKRQWELEHSQGSPEAKALLEASEALRTSDYPVAFPTETVYGLGADATRSAAVRGIYKAKQRPSDNPLIVHFSSIEHLERLLKPVPLEGQHVESQHENETLIPKIYEPLITRFWPGPLTIILPNPPHSPLAPEVTSNLTTFGARMPSAPLARLLIELADRPLAAPSANASTKPSPTTAQHVYSDLQGRVDLILDGGPCGVGVESTVVDGLSFPPAILRPGGVGIEELRACPGWENVRIGYQDGALQGKAAPRAPGMKYRHYSPKAKVVLFEPGQNTDSVAQRVAQDIPGNVEPENNPSPWSIGVVRTQVWKKGLDMNISSPGATTRLDKDSNQTLTNSPPSSSSSDPISHIRVLPSNACDNTKTSTHLIDMFDIDLGRDPSNIARGLFSALRDLDELGVSTIYVEGISDTEGDLSAAVMNRLRKAAEEEIKAAP